MQHGGSGPALDRDKSPCKRLFCNPQPPWEGGTAKSMTEKNNSRVDCAEADKKTVQAQRYEGRGFLAAGDLPSELPVMNYQAKPDRFN